eukprot:scaffold176727_cov18-Tisochrysis_lutea.AAC.2
MAPLPSSMPAGIAANAAGAAAGVALAPWLAALHGVAAAAAATVCGAVAMKVVWPAAGAEMACVGGWEQGVIVEGGAAGAERQLGVADPGCCCCACACERMRKVRGLAVCLLVYTVVQCSSVKVTVTHSWVNLAWLSSLLVATLCLGCN